MRVRFSAKLIPVFAYGIIRLAFILILPGDIFKGDAPEGGRPLSLLVEFLELAYVSPWESVGVGILR